MIRLTRAGIRLAIGGLTLSAALAGCDTCPPALPVMLGNGNVAVAPEGTGQASQKNTTWTFFVNAPITSLPIFGTPVTVPAMAFKAEFGANGELSRVFDNQVLAPETLGATLLIDGILHPAVDPMLQYSVLSYGAEDGSAVGLTSCGLIYAGPLQIIKARVEFSGTTDNLLGKSDGTLRFITEVNPFAKLILPPDVMSMTIEVTGFAIRDGVLPVPPLPGGGGGGGLPGPLKSKRGDSGTVRAEQGAVIVDPHE